MSWKDIAQNQDDERKTYRCQTCRQTQSLEKGNQGLWPRTLQGRCKSRKCGGAYRTFEVVE